MLLRYRPLVPAPRDNVVFETGLFLGKLGKDSTFMVVDRTTELKIPSDFLGITRAYYDPSLLGTYDIAVSSACNEIDRNIRQQKISAHLLRLQGNWISLFASGPFPDQPVLTDKVEISVEGNGVSLTGRSGTIPYTGKGLVVNATADAMYGYSTSQDARGGTIFGTWVFAKSDDRDEQTIMATLLQAQKDLQEITTSPRLEAHKVLLPPSQNPRRKQPQRSKA